MEGDHNTPETGTVPEPRLSRILSRTWQWDVTGTVAVLIFGTGVAAMYGGDYILANGLYLAAVLLAALKVIRWEETGRLQRWPKYSAISGTLVLAIGIFAALTFWTRHTESKHLHIVPVDAAKPPTSTTDPAAITTLASNALQQITATVARIPKSAAIGSTIILTAVILLAIVVAVIRRYRKPRPAKPESTGDTAPDVKSGYERICKVLERDGGYIEVDSLSDDAKAVQAAVVSFVSQNNKTVRVRAQIIYIQEDVQPRIEPVSYGTWLEANQSEVTLSANAPSSELVIALYDGAKMYAVNDNRRELGASQGCVRRLLRYRSTFHAWVKLFVCDADGKPILNEIPTEHIVIGTGRAGPTIDVLGTTGAYRDAVIDTEITPLCDARSAGIEIKNCGGQSAEFWATIESISGPIEESRAYIRWCRWENTIPHKITIAAGKANRLVLANRIPDAGLRGMVGFTRWVVHSIPYGEPVEMKSLYRSHPWLKETTTIDIVLDVMIFSDSKLRGSPERFRIILEPFIASCATP